MKITKKNLSVSIVLAIAFTSVQIITSAQPLSLDIEPTPNRKAEILAKLKAKPIITPERKHEILVRKEDNARTRARIDSLTQDKATVPGAKMINRSPESYQRVTPTPQTKSEKK